MRVVGRQDQPLLAPGEADENAVHQPCRGRDRVHVLVLVLTDEGKLTEAETRQISEGLLAEEVPVTINARIGEYDVLFVAGPVFPHEVVGFSGGNKYFFPGIAGAEILNFFHWLGALITNAEIIKRFLPVSIEIAERGRAWEVQVRT